MGTVRTDHWVRLEMMVLFVVLWMPMLCSRECLVTGIEIVAGDLIVCVLEYGMS